jgi:hypothetical protein
VHLQRRLRLDRAPPAGRQQGRVRELRPRRGEGGSAVPVTFKLGGDQGLRIFAHAGTDSDGNPTYHPTSKDIVCAPRVEVDAIEAV